MLGVLPQKRRENVRVLIWEYNCCVFIAVDCCVFV